MLSEITHGTTIIDIRDGSILIVDIVEEYPEGAVVYTLDNKCIPIQYVQLTNESKNRIIWESIINDQELPKWIQNDPNYKGLFPSLSISDSNYLKGEKILKLLKNKKKEVYSFSIFGYTFKLFKS
jgi:hypothetical protein